MNGPAGAMSEVSRSRDVTVVELLDRLLDKGVVLAGDLTISVAGVDLVDLSLRVLLCSTETAERTGAPTPSETDALSGDALGSSALASRALDSHALDSHALDSEALDAQAGQAGSGDPDDEAAGGPPKGPLESGALGAEMLGSSEEGQED